MRVTVVGPGPDGSARPAGRVDRRRPVRDAAARGARHPETLAWEDSTGGRLPVHRILCGPEANA